MNILAVDLNNDGIPDIVQTSLSNAPCTVTISMGKGDGTFGSPNTFYLDSTQATTCAGAAVDLNGDGNADLVFVIPGPGNEIVAMLGNGDGTFQPAVKSFATLPGNATFDDTILAADLNHDGKADLVVQYDDPDAGYQVSVMVMPGNGAGGFASGNVIFMPQPPGQAADGLSVGDFDHDGNADLAFSASGTVYVLYGDGNFGFTPTTVLTVNGGINISAGDLNSDGNTDLFGIDGATNQLVTLYAEPNRTFAAYYSSLPTSGSLGGGSSCCESILTMADFNGDGRMDLVGTLSRPYPNTTQQLAFFLAGKDKGQFTIQVVNLPSHEYNTNALVADFNRDSKPDVLLALADTVTGSGAYLAAAINKTSGGVWSNCNYPLRAQSIALCAPISYAPSTVSFAATANTLDPLRKMELWVDGKKVAEQHHTWEGHGWFGLNTSLAAGKHSGTIFAGTVGQDLQRLSFAFTVGSSPCAAPSSDGVHICKPIAGTTSSPVLVEAAAKISGSLGRIELWVDGVKKYTERTSTWLTTSVYTEPGTHRFVVYAFNASGTRWESAVNASTGP